MQTRAEARAATEDSGRAETAQARPLEWGRAWSALQTLVADPQRTDQVFEIVDALSGSSFERRFQSFRASATGTELLRQRPSLLAALSDRDTLRRLPDDSLGRRYLDFMERGSLSADGLVEADETAAARSPQRPPSDPEREYFGDRLRDMHDLWHVLTGHGMDEAGEAANLAFTLPQIPNPGLALIVLASAVLGPFTRTLSWQRYLAQALRRGWNASDLTSVEYEALLPRPLDEVRRELGISTPEAAHPAGIIVANVRQPAPSPPRELLEA